MPELFQDLLAKHVGKRPVARLAQRISVHERTLRSWMLGERVPEPDAFDRLREALFKGQSQDDDASIALEDAWQRAREARGRNSTHAKLPRSDAPSAAAPIAAPTRFIGRVSDLSNLVAALLAPGRATALVMGDGGMGKSTLTRQAATHPDVVARFGARRHEAKLEAATTADALLTTLAATLGTDPAQGLPPILARLDTGPTLLMLDNLETPWWAESAATEAILAELSRLPDLALLASLRGGETPRNPRWHHRHDLRPLPPDDARDLFLDIAFRIRPEDALLSRLLDELAGIPLALELVALEAEPDDDLERVWGEWQKSGADLTDAQRGGHRHASLARSIELSLNSPRMGDPGRRLFSLLGVLPAGIARIDQDTLLGDEPGPAERQLRALGLALRRDGRLDLLPPIRRYALAHRPPQGEDALAWARHMLVMNAELGQRMTSYEDEVTARLRREFPNFEAAMRQAAAEPALLPHAKAALWIYSFVCQWAPGGPALQPLAEACRRAENLQGEADCLHVLGDIVFFRLEYEQAQKHYEAALPLYRRLSDLAAEAACLRRLGDIARYRSEHAQARDRYEATLPLYRKLGNVGGEAHALRGLADLLRLDGRIEEARTGYLKVLTMEEGIGATGNAEYTRSRLRRLDS